MLLLCIYISCTPLSSSARLSDFNSVQAAQTELNKAAEDFRRLHAERQELLQQWEDVLAAIAKRDAAILEAGGDFANKKAELSMLKAELDALAAVLQQEEDTGARWLRQHCPGLALLPGVSAGVALCCPLAAGLPGWWSKLWERVQIRKK